MIHKTTRSILSVLLAALLLVTSIPLTPAFAGGGGVSLQSESGEGGELKPAADGVYYISSAEELKEFADKVNDTSGQYTDIDAVLTANIDLSEICSEEEGDSWTPIGTRSNPYSGTFDGANYTISGLYIDSEANYQGLFGYVSSGKVQNLSVSGSVKGNDYVGGVVGVNSGSVINCTNTGSVKGSDNWGSGDWVGGVVGYNSGTVKNCYNTGNISGNRDVGGVVGNNYSGSVENCYNIGTVTSGAGVAGGAGVGGVVGGNDSGTVKNCYNTGAVSGGNTVGGVVGKNSGSNGTVENCYNTGEVSGYWYVGGVVGYNDGGSVTTSYNTGKVSGPDSGFNNAVGGVVGLNSSGDSSASASVTNCYNTGSVSGPNSGTNNYVGGVVGRNSGSTVENCYNIGEVSGMGVGGVVGRNDSGTVTGCYFLQENDVPANGIGGGETTGATPVDNLDELCEALEDSDTWTISENLGRPVLTSNHEGDGTQQHPYRISTTTQLKNFATAVNGGEKSAHAKLMNDIDLKDVCGPELDAETSWEPIGNSEENTYTGTFDGDGHTISGLYIYTGDNNQGLFGRVSGTVQNLSVSGSVSVSHGENVGGIVGYNFSGTVTNCAFSGSVGGIFSGSYVGGIVGYNSSGTVTNCAFSGSVSGNYVGGVVGYNRGIVTNCHNTCTGTVTGTGDYVGGVVGKNEASVTNSYNTGSVKVSGRYVGGVVGYNQSGSSVTTCYNTGTVSGSDYVGGVVGSNSGSVEKCHNTGKVSGRYVGGVVGSNSGTVENCYNTDSVSNGTTSGGVVGQNSGSGSVTGCYFLQQNGVPAQGIGSGTGTATAKDNTAFHSGEVAYLLQGTQTTPVWGQSALGTEDSLPTLVALDKNAETVYQVTVDYNYDGAQNKTTYTNDPAEPAAPARDGYTFGGWDKTGEGTTTITYTAKWTAEEPPYTGKYSYEVSTSVGDHGSLTVDRYATEGDTVTIQVAPDQAYKLDELVVTANGKDVELTANDDGTYTFTMPSADVRITATFAEDPDWTEPEEPATDVSDLFIDVAPNAWYKDAIQYAYDNGLMTGVSATEFDPEATTTRAMIVSILARLEGVTTAEAAGFADVDDNDWYATAVNWAASVGVVNGYEDNTFQPNTAITREQLAAILMNYAAYKGEDVSNRADLATYTDQPSTWAQEAMQWAVAEGLINGVTNDQLQPQGNATRAQVAAILQRLLEA